MEEFKIGNICILIMIKDWMGLESEREVFRMMFNFLVEEIIEEDGVFKLCWFL